jgi:hypothetical protein
MSDAPHAWVHKCQLAVLHELNEVNVGVVPALDGPIWDNCNKVFSQYFHRTILY